MTNEQPQGTSVVNAMSVDVEDYFQVEAFARTIGRLDWDSFERRVHANTDRVLEMLSRHGVRATFFTLGWVALRHPDLVRRIVAGGHELASHGVMHHRVVDLTPQQFRNDVSDSKHLLEDLVGVQVRGYRAPSFSIGRESFWAFEVLAEAGYAYSSSVFPIRHDLYGMPEAPRVPFRPSGLKEFLEIPMTTVRIRGRNLPCSGGGYFRLLPYRYSRWGIDRVNRVERRPAVFYFHPWEIDPDQPRQRDIPWKCRFRHYTNLGRMADRLERLLADFKWDRMDMVYADVG